MSFIISKLDVKNLKTSIIYASDNEDDCKAKLLDLIQDNENINKIIENDYIKSFCLNKGFLYNTKSINNIYQILKLPDNEDD